MVCEKKKQFKVNICGYYSFSQKIKKAFESVHEKKKPFKCDICKYIANVCRDLQGLCRGFLQYMQGKSCNIYRFSLQFLQSVNIAGKICKYYRIFPADIAENPCRVPVNPIKPLQCNKNRITIFMY